MREFKFRGWDNKTNSMDTYFNITSQGIVNDAVIGNNPKDKSHYILEQFIGLLDLKGSEIYEGDILKCTSQLFSDFGKTPTGKNSTTIYEVFFNSDKGAWAKRVLQSDRSIIGSISDSLHITKNYSVVIGNIHENPELLY